jgi:uncharacterized protein (DUF697 family)
MSGLPDSAWSRSLLVGAAAGRGLAGNALAFVQIMREIDPAAAERELRRPLRLLVSGTDAAPTQQLASRLFGPSDEWSPTVDLVPPAALGRYGPSPDAVLLVVGSSYPAATILADYRQRRPECRAPVVAVLQDQTEAGLSPVSDGEPRVVLVSTLEAEPDSVSAQAIGALLEAAPGLTLVLGYRFPAFRGAVAERLIRESSLANAQFALFSSLPASIPLVGGFAGDMADLVLLTKNQGLLVYKLAGLHGRDLQKRVKLLVEIAPVVGGAFFWRSVARSLLGLLPTIVGGIPKAAIAYVGTYLVGQMARYYYSTGERPAPELVKRFQEDGARLARELAARLGRG